MNHQIGRRRNFPTLVLADKRLCAAQASRKGTLRFAYSLPSSKYEFRRIGGNILHGAQHIR